jgi:hypothetical protein
VSKKGQICTKVKKLIFALHKMGYRGGHTVRHGPHHHNNGYNGHSNNNNNNSHYNNKSMMDQQMVAAEQTICFCFRFLNPLGNYFG